MLQCFMHWFILNVSLCSPLYGVASKNFIYRLVYSISNDQIPRCTVCHIFLFIISRDVFQNDEYEWCSFYVYVYMLNSIATYISHFDVRVCNKNSIGILNYFLLFLRSNWKLRFKSLPYGRAIRTNALNTTYTHRQYKTDQTHIQRARSLNNYGKTRCLSEVQQSIMGDECAEKKNE